MWYRNRNGDSVKPEAVDNTSSKKWAYVRKDFVLVEAEEHDGQIYPAHWEWLELKLPKEALDIYTQTTNNADDVETLSEAIVELAEIIGGGE